MFASIVWWSYQPMNKMIWKLKLNDVCATNGEQGGLWIRFVILNVLSARCEITNARTRTNRLLEAVFLDQHMRSTAKVMHQPASLAEVSLSPIEDSTIVALPALESRGCFGRTQSPQSATCVPKLWGWTCDWLAGMSQVWELATYIAIDYIHFWRMTRQGWPTSAYWVAVFFFPKTATQ